MKRSVFLNCHHFYDRGVTAFTAGSKRPFGLGKCINGPLDDGNLIWSRKYKLSSLRNEAKRYFTYVEKVFLIVVDFLFSLHSKQREKQRDGEDSESLI